MGGSTYWPRYEPPRPTPKNPNPPKEPTETDSRLLRDYQNLRLDCADLEELLGSDTVELSERDRKELDKAVVAMKIGFKLIKNRLRKRGWKGRLKQTATLGD